jgi:hypothetical protein
MKNLAAHIEQQFREKAVELRHRARRSKSKRLQFLRYAQDFEHLADTYRAGLKRLERRT